MIKKGDYFLYKAANEHWGTNKGIIIQCSKVSSGMVFGFAVSPPNCKIIAEEESRFSRFEANFGTPNRHLTKLP